MPDINNRELDRVEDLTYYFRVCPELENLLPLAGVEEEGNSIILPQGSSPAKQVNGGFDVTGRFEADIVPYDIVYEDYQINCYKFYNTKDPKPPARNENILTEKEVRRVCQWVKEQDNIGNFPDIGESVICIECLPFVPQIRYVDDANNLVCYYITVRIYYVNRAERKTIEYGYTD